MLLGLLRAVNEHPIRCPEDVSIMGFDDFPWTRHLTPPLTVLGQPTREIGREAIRLLLRKIRAAEGSEPENESIRLKAELRIRASTAPPADPKTPLKRQAFVETKAPAGA
jgi:LacI family transcriptional regulator